MHLCCQFGQNVHGMVPRIKIYHVASSKNQDFIVLPQVSLDAHKVAEMRQADLHAGLPSGGSDIRGGLFRGLFLQMISDMSGQIVLEFKYIFFFDMQSAISTPMPDDELIIPTQKPDRLNTLY